MLGSPTADTTVAKTQLWALADEEFVGRIAIHHELTDALRVEGGHIGYDTVPSFRGRGVATEMLRQVLPVARKLGLTEVLLTCDDTNAASIRVVERTAACCGKRRCSRRRELRSAITGSACPDEPGRAAIGSADRLASSV